jgi:16S rRNA (cytidine1402-2'-O)-methyltransferase
MTGSLVLVATPIGNLGDMSERAIETLRTADVVACEDTRHTRKLLNHFNLTDVNVISVHEHNERERAAEVVERVRNGQTVALVTDAGMPAISDPGQVVVMAMAAESLPVSVVPGPSAVVAALAVSGLDTSRFCFDGFLPRKGKARNEALDEIVARQLTTVIYESPHRVLATVSDLAKVCGPGRMVALVRELTKIHEEVWRGSVEDLVEHLSLRNEIKGECVLVISGLESKAESGTADTEVEAALGRALDAGLSKKDAVAAVAAVLGVAKNRVYEVATRTQRPGN